MNLQEYEYHNTDQEYAEIRQFLLKLGARGGCPLIWDPGRMDWWRYNVNATKPPAFFEENVRYWKHEGEVAGLSISEYGKDTFFVVAHPDFPPVYPAAFGWINRSWAPGRGTIRTSFYDCDPDMGQVLTEYGFSQNGIEGNHRTYALDRMDLSYSLPEGFRIMPYHEYGNVSERVAVTNSAFPYSKYTADRLASLLTSPELIPELHLVAVSPRGRCAAYSIGWEDPCKRSEGFIEPMGVHEDFRRMGIGQAMVKEIFRRLLVRGIKTAVIGSKPEPDPANLFYESLKPVKRMRSLLYTREER